MEKSESIKEIATALSKAQGDMEIALKQAKGYNYKFADYCTVWNCVRKPLFDNGLCVVQDAISDDQGVSVITTIMHNSGEWLSFGPLTVPIGKRDAHSTGSAISYSRRYALCAALHIVTDDDDDGAAAMKSGPPTQPPKPKVKEFTQTQMDSWVFKWAEQYCLSDIEEFCQARADHFQHTLQMTCAELAADEKIFVKNIEAWLKKNAKEE